MSVTVSKTIDKTVSSTILGVSLDFNYFSPAGVISEKQIQPITITHPSIDPIILQD